MYMCICLIKVSSWLNIVLLLHVHYNSWRVGDILKWLGINVKYSKTVQSTFLTTVTSRSGGIFLGQTHRHVCAISLVGFTNISAQMSSIFFTNSNPFPILQWMGYLSLSVIALVYIPSSCRKQLFPSSDIWGRHEGFLFRNHHLVSISIIAYSYISIKNLWLNHLKYGRIYYMGIFLN